MATPIRPDEPVIVYTVRSLIEGLREDFAKRFDDLGAKLDDRVTLGVFRALQSELDATKKRLADVEAELDDIKEWRTTVKTAAAVRLRVSDRALAWAALGAAVVGSVATIVWLWIGG